MIPFHEVAIGSGGGVACIRCHGRVEEVHASSEEIVARLRPAAARDVVLTGAEPFGHPGLPGLIAEAVSAGCQRLMLDTDCVALQSPGNAHGSLNAGVRHLRFTLLGGSTGLHDALCGAPGRFSQTIAGLATFRAAADEACLAIHAIAVLPVCRHNHTDLPGMAAAAVENGADELVIRVDDGGLDLASLVPWVTAACDTGVVNSVWVAVEGIPFCVLGEHAVHAADVVGPRQGTKAVACAACPLDDVCGGAAAGASADQLACLSVPARAAHLASRVRVARGVAHRG